MPLGQTAIEQLTYAGTRKATAAMGTQDCLQPQLKVCKPNQSPRDVTIAPPTSCSVQLLALGLAVSVAGLVAMLLWWAAEDSVMPGDP
jgi:hypothetical protein